MSSKKRSHRYPRKFKATDERSCDDARVLLVFAAGESCFRYNENLEFLSRGVDEHGIDHSLVPGYGWVEVFDHHPPDKVQILFLKQLAKELRQENGELRGLIDA